MKVRPAFLSSLLSAAALAAGGCAQVQAKAAYQDGNKLYKEENYKRAVEKYEAAVKHDPNMIEAHFYLGSSRQALYRPGKGDAQENKGHLESAIDSYKTVLKLS